VLAFGLVHLQALDCTVIISVILTSTLQQMHTKFCHLNDDKVAFSVEEDMQSTSTRSHDFFSF